MTLKYPLELEDGVNDYIIFTAHPYRTNKPIPGQRNPGGGEAPAAGDPIVLYMPNSTPAAGNGQTWGSSKLEGPLGDIRRSLAVGAADIVMEPGAAIGNMGSKISDQINKIKSQAGPAAQQVVINAVAALAGTNANGLLAMQRGQIYNPNVELLYDGPGLREFGFAFNFIPKSAAEATAANSIIKEFKKWSSPKEEGSMFEVPHIWNIQYMTNGKKNMNMNQFKKCALTSITVQANPTSDLHQAFPDGMPVVTSMTLAFQEVDIITRKDHETGNQGF